MTQSIIGTPNNDILTSDSDTTFMHGLEGDDVITYLNESYAELHGASGDDNIYVIVPGLYVMGGTGHDKLSFIYSTSGVDIDQYNRLDTSDMDFDGVEGIEEIELSQFNDWLRADEEVQIVRGMGGDDYLLGFGQLLYDGGDGNDTIANAGVFQGNDTYLLDMTDTSRFISIENADGTIRKDLMYGDEGNNTLNGLSGDDVIEGRGGADILDGGEGIDTLSYSGSATAVAIDLELDIMLGGDAEGDHVSGFEIIRGSAHSDVLRGGNTTNNHISAIYGEDGDDILRPTGSGIILNGGNGKDIVSHSLWTSGVVVDMTASGGTGNTYIAIEQVNGSQYSDQISGTSSPETFIGFAGDDILRGRGGADLLDGRGGTDIATYSDSAEAVRIDLGIGLGSGGDAEGDRLISIENVNGSAFNDTLEGDGGANHFIGFAGDDTLRGRGGADILDGRDGIDVATYSTSTTGVHIDLALGQGFGGEAEGDRLISIEIVNGSMHDDTLEGGADDDTLRGFDGNDILRGRGGADVLDGRTGSDIATYSDSNAAVQVDLAYGTGTGGHAQGDQLISVEGVNGSAFDDVLQGSLSSDALRGFDGNDTLRGRDGNDILDGRNGKDVIVGGHGADLLLGGAGADRFVYSSITESTKTLSGRDTILDFSHTQGDRIDLSPVDANVTLSGNQTFTFIGTAAYSGTAGQVRYAITAEGTIVYADTDGDRISDMTILLNGNHALTAADFAL